MTHLYQHAILGGTFDHLHTGHKHFLTAALPQAKHVTIGLARPILYKDKPFAHTIESYNTRESKLKLFLDGMGFTGSTTIVPIEDIYGPALTDQEIEAIFVTQSTLASAEAINHHRHDLGLLPLTIVTIPLLCGDDDYVISSSRIRAGEIDDRGDSYSKFFLRHKTDHLSEGLRRTLQTPLGAITTNLAELPSLLPASSTIIAVGDIVSIDLMKSGYRPAVCIVDHHSRRRKLASCQIKKYFPLAHASLINVAGTINPQIISIFLTSLASYWQTKETQVIKVSGEEDLLALPALLLAPLGSYLVYGQYNVGMCIVKVTASTKSLAKRYLTQF